ncbi:hypothetical protein MRB53_030245 [Persea americana]|uniref:Uncharacterized protein n=1 Tax=Persea americana TaxID=3435 RepID=A0ACC2KKR8_PERAE|nr:hypothetical protein MRB53_030245 [Persea americana]
MASLSFLSFLLTISLGLTWTCQGYEFFVGGTDGWVLNPSEKFNHWAERNRFQVNDTLVFSYKKEEDSVLVVNKEDYEKCNTNNPISRFSDGYSVFKLDRSGPFFFISGMPEKCEKGEKLIVVVMAVRGSHNPPISPPPATEKPPAQAPISPSGSPGERTAPAPSPERSYASPPLFSLTASGSSLGVVIAVVFGCLIGSF